MQNIRNIILFVFLFPLLIFGQQKHNPAGDDVLLTEEIILSADRDFYLAGEKIWFSATVLLNGRKVPADFSRILFVELIGLNKGQHALSKHQITDGMVNGVVDIPEGLPTGYYVLRAYTTYQQNRGPSAYAAKAIAILNPTLALVGVEDDPKHNFEAFALNGREDENKRFGIQLPIAMLRDKPKIWVGIADTSLIYPVRYFDNGLAYFSEGSHELPQKLTLYFQSESDKIPKVYELLLKSEVYLSVEQKGNSLSVKGHLADSIEMSLLSDSIYLLNAQNEVIGSQALSFQQKQFNITFANTNLKYGLYYAVLKTNNNALIAAEAFFYKKPAHDPIRVHTDKKVYNVREQLRLNIEAKSDGDKIDNFSVAVVADKTVWDANDFPTYLVSNPGLMNSFMQETTSKSPDFKLQKEILLQQYANRLMNQSSALTFRSEPDKENYYVDSRGVNLSGVLRDKATNLPVKGVDIYLSIFGDKPQLQIYTTDPDGSFRFSLRHIADLTTIYLVYNAPGSNELEMLINKDYSSQFPVYENVPFIPGSAMKEFIEEAYRNAQITETYHEQLTINPTEKDALRFHAPDEEIYLDDYVPMQSLEAVLNELVPFARIKWKKKKAYLEVLDGVTHIGYDNPLILLDDLPIFNVDDLLEIHPAKLESVKVLNSTYIYGDHILKGIVIITTKTENFGGYPLPISFTAIEYNAARSPSSYAAIVYDSKSTDNRKRVPDFRNLLYWNPQLKPASKDTSLSFYTSDYKGEFKVLIHGISKSGEPFSSQTKFTVK